MTNFYKRIENEMVFAQYGRGEGSGPASRILSSIWLIGFVYLLVHLLKDHQYIPLGILLIFGFTRFGFLTMLGLLIYFLFAKYWSGASLILLCGLIGWLSGWFGTRNIRKNLYSEKLNLDPFEGMADVLFVTILSLALFSLALLTSGILSAVFWAIFGILILFQVYRYYHRLRSPWRRLHHPLLIRYSGIAGKHMANEKITKQEFDVEAALRDLVSNIYSHWLPMQVDELINAAKQRMLNFSDRELVKRSLQMKNPSLGEEALREMLSRGETALKGLKDNSLFVRYVIGEIVEREYGDKEREKYITAVVAGIPQERKLSEIMFSAAYQKRQG